MADTAEAPTAGSLTDIVREEEPEAAIASEWNLDDPALYQNRELSWLDFNDRVFAEAKEPAQPESEIRQGLQALLVDG